MDRDKRNIIVLTGGETLWGIQSALIFPATVLTVLLTRFGAEETMIGAVDAIGAGGIVLPQIIGMYLFHSRAHRKRNIIIWHFIAMVPIVALMGLVILFSDRLGPILSRWLLLGSYLVFTCAIGIILAVWLDWIASVFPPNRRGTAMGVSWASSAVAGTAAGLVTGYLITHNQGTEVYAYLYFAAAVIMSGAMLLVSCMDDRHTHEETTPLKLRVLLQHFRTSLRDRNVQNLIIGRLVARAGFCIIPFIAVYFSIKGGGKLSAGTIVSCGAAQTVGVALGSLVLGKIGDIRGHRLGLIIGALAQVVALIMLLISQEMHSCIIAYFATGICVACDMTSHSNMIFETCPHDNRIAHITVTNLAMGVGAILFPLLAGYLASQTSLRLLFYLSLAISLVAVCWLSLVLKEPRKNTSVLVEPPIER